MWKNKTHPNVNYELGISIEAIIKYLKIGMLLIYCSISNCLSSMVNFSLSHLQTNTFQGIIITNGVKSYAVFIYQCGALTSHNNGTIGYNADGSFFHNYPLSGSGRVLEAACLNHPSTVWSNLVYSLTPSSGKVHRKYAWYFTLSHTSSIITL